jgi:hypothetical protein
LAKKMKLTKRHLFLPSFQSAKFCCPVLGLVLIRVGMWNSRLDQRISGAGDSPICCSKLRLSEPQRPLAVIGRGDWVCPEADTHDHPHERLGRVESGPPQIGAPTAWVR